jgi:hypothetical protein
MKKLAILTTAAVLGVSSLAVADPVVVVRDHRNDGDRLDGRFDRDDDRDDDDRPYYFDDDDDFGESRFTRDRDGRYWRGDREFIRAEQQAQWVSLGTAGSGKTVLKANGRYQSIRLDTTGWLRIKQVAVKFADGSIQKVRVNDAGRGRRHAPLVMDLAGNKRVERVYIYASHYGRGTVTVSGLQAKRYYWKRFHAR